ncbi:MAG: CDP-glucose 4,6-dehydratase [Geobacteraceae bacterium]
MENMEMSNHFWYGKRVFLTGHTGFKGGWLALWLQMLGAEVYGYALEPPTEINLFTVARVEEGMADSIIDDICNSEKLKAAMLSAQPEAVFHLAAQPLVRYSYAEPVETYATNVMGTLHLLEAVRSCPLVKAVVNVTTDKCYENREWIWGCREYEPMGGHDPYSSSKACSEIITSAYRRSFFAQANIAVATARAGNVIGGGDWATDRLIPDFLRAIDTGEKLMIRSPQAIRPWQHVLEPLSGYLLLAERLYTDCNAFAEPWNFGPADEDVCSVRGVIEYITAMRPEISWEYDNATHPHEANYLKLDSSKAHAKLDWYPRWDLKTALTKTMEWHRAWQKNTDMREFTLSQIYTYQQQFPRVSQTL